jgi:hypothetical protein
MKKIIVLIALSSLDLVYANGIKIRVDPDTFSVKSDSDKNANRRINELEHRVAKLEKALNKLQNRSSRKNHNRPSRKPHKHVVRKWSCSIRDRFGKTFVGNGDNRVEAAANAMKQCDGIFCNKKDLDCSQ